MTLVRWNKPDVENKRIRTYFRDINLIQHWHGHGDHGHWHLSKVSEGKVLCNLSNLFNHKGCGEGPKVPTSQVIVCHFSQGHAMDTSQFKN